MTKDGKFYLTHDDLVCVKSGDSYRIRVWMSRNSEHCDAVVIVDPTEGSSPPEYNSVVLGNLIFRRHLQYRLARYRIFERSVKDGIPRVFRVTYDMGGTHHRPVLVSAHYVGVNPKDIAKVLGVSVTEVFA